MLICQGSVLPVPKMADGHTYICWGPLNLLEHGVLDDIIFLKIAILTCFGLANFRLAT
jgi:hypothetical protein